MPVNRQETGKDTVSSCDESPREKSLQLNGRFITVTLLGSIVGSMAGCTGARLYNQFPNFPVISCDTPTDEDKAEASLIVDDDSSGQVTISHEQSLDGYEQPAKVYREAIARELGLTIPDMSEVIDALESDAAKLMSVENYVKFASDNLKSTYGIAINLEQNSVKSLGMSEIDTKNEANDSRIRESTVALIEAVNYYPVELVDMASLEDISLADISNAFAGIGLSSSGYAIIKDRKIVLQYDQPPSTLTGTFQHELFHHLNDNLCGRRFGRLTDTSWNRLNPKIKGGVYGDNWMDKDVNDQAVTTLYDISHQLIATDLDSPNLIANEPYGLSNILEDKATNGKIILENPSLELENNTMLQQVAQSESPLGDKVNYLLAQIYAKNPAVLTWLLKSGDVGISITSTDEVRPDYNSIEVPEEIIRKYRLGDVATAEDQPADDE